MAWNLSNKFRPLIRRTVDNIFFSWRGLALDPDQVSCQLDSSCIKSGTYDNHPGQLKFPCNLARKLPRNQRGRDKPLSGNYQLHVAQLRNNSNGLCYQKQTDNCCCNC